MRTATLPGLALLALMTWPAACGQSPTEAYDPDLPTAWASAVTNPFFPLAAGTVWEYEAETDAGTETITVEVLSQTRVVNGVTAVVVHDQVFLEGELIENTYDWYAQDADGNVWYLGEETEELENGVVVSTDGSWEWNVDGALPGIYMWANPGAHVGEEYRQEYYEDEAEDWGKLVALNQTVTVPFGSFTGCIVTEDWNAVEGRSQTLENKSYCPGIGVALEIGLSDPSVRVELMDRTP
jgi:hypothetical protein